MSTVIPHGKLTPLIATRLNMRAPPTGPDPVPLCVDLDGTLIYSDLLWESLLRLARERPGSILRLPLWYGRGLAHLKRQIASRVSVDPASLPYHSGFLEYLQAQKAAGRPIYLVTATDQALAEPVGAHLQLFDAVLGSDGGTNLRADAKAAALVARFGERGFDYAGNSSRDLPVWRRARRAVVVNAGDSLVARARKLGEVERVFPPAPAQARAWLQAVRPGRWFKNLLVFVPLLFAAGPPGVDAWSKALMAFAAFCGCASGVYLIRDLLNLTRDRRDRALSARPFAAGTLPPQAGLAMWAALWLVAAGLAASLGWGFAAVLGVYVAVGALIAWKPQRMVFLSVPGIATLYLLRVVGGYEAAGLGYQHWVLRFAFFVFLGLALFESRGRFVRE